MNSILLQTSTVVEASALTRRYGHGETTVDALRGVDLGIATGQLTAVMGPSGSRKSTPMHILARLGKPPPGGGENARPDNTPLSHNHPPPPPRRHLRLLFPLFHP